MTPVRQLKKSETLEVRLPHASKVAFMARCRSQGVTASEVVREMIEASGCASGRTGRRAAQLWQALVVAGAGVIIGAVSAPSIAQALPGSHAAFQRLDTDRDGVVTFAEFEAR